MQIATHLRWSGFRLSIRQRRHEHLLCSKDTEYRKHILLISNRKEGLENVFRLFRRTRPATGDTTLCNTMVVHRTATRRNRVRLAPAELRNTGSCCSGAVYTVFVCATKKRIPIGSSVWSQRFPTWKKTSTYYVILELFAG